MYAPLPSALKPARVLILSRSDTPVTTDVKVLRALGASTLTYLSDTVSALSFLRKECDRVASIDRIAGKPGFALGIDVIICNDMLDDGPVSIFLYALAQEKSLRSLPVLILTGSEKKADALRALRVPVLERPYATDDMAHILQKAMSPMRIILRPEALEKAATAKKLPLQQKVVAKKKSQADSEPLTGRDWYARGMDHLRDGMFKKAELSFCHALEKDEDYVDAAVAMSRVQRSLGDERQAVRYLLWAAASSLRLGDQDRSNAISAKLPEKLQKDIFFHEAVLCLQENRYRQAAVNFLDAGNADSADNKVRPLHGIVARASTLTREPETNLRKLCDAFDSMGQTSIANLLRNRLLNYQPFEPAKPSSWLDAYPFIKEVVSVVSYTAWAWKQV